MRVIGRIRTDKVGSQVEFEVEVPDEELAELDALWEKNDLIDEYVHTAMWNYAEWGWKLPDAG